MRIRIIKRTGRPALLSCHRDDGTSTIAEIAPGPSHDLAHYAVETTLNLRRAFFGLVAGGMNLQDFDVPGAVKRLALHDAAC
ncbi:MAG: hypothetical protein IPJ41_09865 [Phycisphaerales bacterium]|nr:hypothetical protein [Phycisphaerales bacterium]